MSLQNLDTLLGGQITPKKWVTITDLLDKVSKKEIDSALKKIEDASATWPKEISANYFSSMLPPERMLKNDPSMEVRVCPRTWHADLFDGQDLPKFSTLRVLMPHGNDRIKAKHLMNLLQVSHMQALRYLCLDQIKPSGAFVKAIKKEHNLVSLTHFRMWYADHKPLGASLLKGLVEANLPNLRHLNMGQNQLDHEFCDLVITSGAFEGLEELDLQNNSLGAPGITALSTAHFIPNLHVLNLGYTRMDDEALEALLPRLGAQLHTLSINCNTLTDRGIRALANAAHLTGLHTLNLCENNLTEEGVTALITAPYLQTQLRKLFVGNGLTQALAQRMVAESLLPELEYINASPREAEGRDAVEVIHQQRPKLASA